MTHTDPDRLKSLLDRLGRLMAAQEWGDGLNPAQRSALDYLARANRFSRAPSHVADYLCTTRGTASQTLKALHRKGLIAPEPKPGDKRSISYDITPAGRSALDTENELEVALGTLPPDLADAGEEALSALLQTMLARRSHVPFGICRDCRHHEIRGNARHCGLLNATLSDPEAGKICHEFAPPAR